MQPTKGESSRNQNALLVSELARFLTPRKLIICRHTSTKSINTPVTSSPIEMLLQYFDCQLPFAFLVWCHCRLLISTRPRELSRGFERMTDISCRRQHGFSHTPLAPKRQETHKLDATPSKSVRFVPSLIRAHTIGKGGPQFLEHRRLPDQGILAQL